MKKIGFLIVAFVIVLGSLGMGYAIYTSNLTIGGTAVAGTWDVHFQYNAFENDGHTYGNVITPATVHVTGDGTQILTVSITNAAPGLHIPFVLGLHNSGTLQAHVVMTPDVTGLPVGSTVVCPAPFDFGTLAGYDDFGGTMTIDFPSTLSNAQMVPGATYTFTVAVVASQVP